MKYTKQKECESPHVKKNEFSQIKCKVKNRRNVKEHVKL